ncbi:lipocalin family protein [Tsukamurella sp. 8F]|uniref:lipocalin family protein n=1 Tax=Tsukamurella sp. 8F TaxID=3031961 RepID=UPI0023BA3282|nr:lipocalin family protein [Tsukamurella sp. 8F]MDF0586120.1 lipocalin family protein [Tsukamurella sp. 8F]
MNRTTLITGAVLALSSIGASPAAASPLAPVPKVDVARYVGSWHQLAAVPAPFNLQCARDSVATYRVIDARRISVVNTCTTWAGTTDRVSGTATVTDPRTSGRLSVRFDGVPGQDAVAGRTNYVVAALAPDYSWAFVGDPARLSAFVLSRNASASPAQWAGFRDTARRLGYNPCTILTSPTTGGQQRIVPLCALP